MDLSPDDWFLLYSDLVDWQIKFDKYKDIGLANVLFDQMQSCNKEFVSFFLSNYLNGLVVMTVLYFLMISLGIT